MNIVKCPRCGSKNLTRYADSAKACDDCGRNVMEYKFSRLGTRSPPVYLVLSKTGVCLGSIEATSASPRRGRNKAKYLVFPQKAKDNVYSTKERSIGPVDSRPAAFSAIWIHLGKTIHGRTLLAKAGLYDGNIR